jgi:hypothetical protein
MGTGKDKDSKAASLKIKILRPAEADLVQGAQFYEVQAAGLGAYFLDSLFADIDSLAYFGGIHPRNFSFHRMLSKRFPFAIYYRKLNGDVIVYAVLDCRRNPTWIRRHLLKS